MSSQLRVAEKLLSAMVRPIMVESKFDDVDEVMSMSNDGLYVLNVVDDDVDDYKLDFDESSVITPVYAKIDNSSNGSASADVIVEHLHQGNQVNKQNGLKQIFGSGFRSMFRIIESKSSSAPTTTTTSVATPTLVKTKFVNNGGKSVESNEHSSLRRKLFNYFHRRRLRKDITLYDKHKYQSTMSFSSRRSISGSFKSFSKLTSSWFNYSKQDVSFRPEIELESLTFCFESTGLSFDGSIRSVLSVISNGSLLFDVPDEHLFTKKPISMVSDIKDVSLTSNNSRFDFPVIPREHKFMLPLGPTVPTKSKIFSIRVMKPFVIGSSSLIVSQELELLKNTNQFNLNKFETIGLTSLRNLQINLSMGINNCGSLVRSTTIPISTTSIIPRIYVSIPKGFVFSYQLDMRFLNQFGFLMGMENRSGPLDRSITITTTSNMTVIPSKYISYLQIFAQSHHFGSKLRITTIPSTFVSSQDFVVPHKLGIHILKYFGFTMTVKQGNGTVRYGNTFICHTEVTTFGFIISYELGIKLISIFGLDMNRDGYSTGSDIIPHILMVFHSYSGFKNSFMKALNYFGLNVDFTKFRLVRLVNTGASTTTVTPPFLYYPFNLVHFRSPNLELILVPTFSIGSTVAGSNRLNPSSIYAVSLNARLVNQDFDRIKELEILNHSHNIIDFNLSDVGHDDDLAGSDHSDEDSYCSVSSFQSDISGISDITSEDVIKCNSDDSPSVGQFFGGEEIDDDFSTDDYSNDGSSECSDDDFEADANFQEGNLEVTTLSGIAIKSIKPTSRVVIDSRSLQELIELYFKPHYQSYLRSLLGKREEQDGLMYWPYWTADGGLDVIVCSNDPENFLKYTTTVAAAAAVASDCKLLKTNGNGDNELENILDLYSDREPIYGHDRWLPLKTKKPYVKSKLSQCYTCPRTSCEDGTTATTTTAPVSRSETGPYSDYNKSLYSWSLGAVDTQHGDGFASNSANDNDSEVDDDDDALNLPPSHLDLLYQLEEGNYQGHFEDEDSDAGYSHCHDRY